MWLRAPNECAYPHRRKTRVAGFLKFSLYFYISLIYFSMLFSLLWLRCAALRLTLSLISVKQKGVQHLIKYSRRDRAANKRPDNIDSTAAKVVNGRKPRPHLNKSHFKRAPTALPFPFSFPFRSPQTKDLSDERDATRRTANGRCCSLRGA